MKQTRNDIKWATQECRGNGAAEEVSGVKKEQGG